jgi:phosphoglycolate phosphatase-like HAD superfamily hydrolase
MKRGVVFDLDGTLLDSMPQVLRMFGHAVSPFIDPLSDDQWRSRLGGPPRRILETVLENPLHVGEAMARLTEYQLVYLNRILAFGGMKVLFDDLSRAGVATGIWTGRDRRSTEALMDEHRIRGMITALVCGDDLATHKPHPEGLSEVLRGLDVKTTDALFVGDSDVDVLAGAALGVKTVWITHGLEINPSIAAQAWRVVNTPTEAYSIVRGELIEL